MKLYRGLTSDHPAFALAQRGIAMPRDPKPAGALSEEDSKRFHDMHVGGNTQTPFTSWTDHFGVASYYACKAESPGVILQADILDTLIFQPQSYQDYFNQMEYLVLGKVNAEAIRAPDCPGIYSIFG